MRISDWSSDVCSSDLQWGLPGDRLHLATEQWSELAGGLAIHAVPAAHPLIERDTLGHLRYVGYVFEHRDRRMYLAEIGKESCRERVCQYVSISVVAVS